ncbi:mitochondrial carrier domain-containing protein [Xylaria bambusicola]|uniref:mitochondrial carrier domain-containing protein n=1 Tax=Xylaria bambusicola TaxID=326684 RepID=UPI0020079D95|nr:mitochondrial carrier domain-containing protein [Xylaria bambusicola]KAI0512773.1 mitochondrial carrier domain-containing protein [Xylaria bambusicola]
MAPSTTSSSSFQSTNNVLPALHHASSGSIGTLISTCSLYPLSLVIARLQVQRQLRRRRQGQQQRRRRTGEGTKTEKSSSGPGQDPRGDRDPSAPDPRCTRLPDRPRTSPADPRREDRRGEEVDSREKTQATGVLPEDRPRRRPKRPTAEYDGIVDAFSQIWSSGGDGGLRAFYTGLAQDAPKSVLDSFLFFLFYEWFRAIRLRRRGGRRGLRVVEELAVGVAAGACSRGFTTPIANVVTRKQTATLLDSTHGGPTTVRDIVRGIWSEKGLAGFWAGYSASLVLTLNPSLTFFLQESLKASFAEQTYDDPGPRLTFLFAATSKAVSSFVTYPFQIAKTRLQAGLPVDPEEEEEDQFEHDDSHDENKTMPIRAVKNLAQRSVFGTVAHIIRTEGFESLYDGVGAELLKGFFSHGTTMLAKDMVHKFLFKLYIFALGLLTEMRRRRRSGQSIVPLKMLYRAYAGFIPRRLRGVTLA